MPLTDVPWLAALPAEALAMLEARSVRRRLARGQVLFREGETFDALAVVLAGKLEIVREAGSRRLVLRQVGAGTCVGMSLIAGARAGAAVRAVTSETRVQVVPGAEVRAVFTRHPQAAVRALAALSNLVDALTDELVEARTVGLEERVRRTVLRLGAGQRELAMTQKALADAVGASRERVNRALAALEARGLLRRHLGRIELL